MTSWSSTIMCLSLGRWQPQPFSHFAIVPDDVNSSSAGHEGNHSRSRVWLLPFLPSVSNHFKAPNMVLEVMWTRPAAIFFSHNFSFCPVIPFLCWFSHALFALISSPLNKETLFKQSPHPRRCDWSQSWSARVKGLLSERIWLSWTCSDWGRFNHLL